MEQFELQTDYVLRENSRRRVREDDSFWHRQVRPKTMHQPEGKHESAIPMSTGSDDSSHHAPPPVSLATAARSSGPASAPADPHQSQSASPQPSSSSPRPTPSVLLNLSAFPLISAMIAENSKQMVASLLEHIDARFERLERRFDRLEQMYLRLQMTLQDFPRSRD